MFFGLLNLGFKKYRICWSSLLGSLRVVNVNFSRSSVVWLLGVIIWKMLSFYLFSTNASASEIMHKINYSKYMWSFWSSHCVILRFFVTGVLLTRFMSKKRTDLRFIFTLSSPVWHMYTASRSAARKHNGIISSTAYPMATLTKHVRKVSSSTRALLSVLRKLFVNVASRCITAVDSSLYVFKFITYAVQMDLSSSQTHNPLKRDLHHSSRRLRLLLFSKRCFHVMYKVR